jgi:riboflavin synthase
VFTGIIETTGAVDAIERRGDLTRLVIGAAEIAGEVAVGDSVAVNGTCLTVTGASAGEIHFDAVLETLAKTSLGDLNTGSRVNLERAMRAGGRLDGHIVQGHVDGVGRVRALERDGDDVRLYVDCGSEISQFLVTKGSVAIDGVSLTVVGVGEGGFDVALIPLTLTNTTLGERRAGDRVNLEADVLGKYVKQYLDRVVPKRDDPPDA